MNILYIFSKVYIYINNNATTAHATKLIFIQTHIITLVLCIVK